MDTEKNQVTAKISAEDITGEEWLNIKAENVRMTPKTAGKVAEARAWMTFKASRI